MKSLSTIPQILIWRDFLKVEILPLNNNYIFINFLNFRRCCRRSRAMARVLQALDWCPLSPPGLWFGLFVCVFGFVDWIFECIFSIAFCWVYFSWIVMVGIYFGECFDIGIAICSLLTSVFYFFRDEIMWWGGLWLKKWIGLGDFGFLLYQFAQWWVEV